MSRILGMVPVKTNSERLPAKNLQPLGGKPMFYHAFNALKEYCDMTWILSNDLDQYTVENGYAFLKHCLLKVPDHLMRGEVPVQATIKWAIRNQINQEYYDYVAYILPNCPMIRKRDVAKAVALITKEKLNVVRSYNKQGNENGLHIYERDYFMTHFTDVYCGGIIAPGFEVHTPEDMEQMRIEWKK